MTDRSLTRQQIVSSLTFAMHCHGWELRSFARLPKVFAKNVVVTPYYLIGDIRRTGDGWYSLGGDIGVIHQTFEDLWNTTGMDPELDALPTCNLMIANLRAISEASYVRAASLTEDMDGFVAVLDSVLTKMPHSEEELIAAFANGTLCGRPIDNFSGYAQRPKFAEWRRFVAGLGKSS